MNDPGSFEQNPTDSGLLAPVENLAHETRKIQIGKPGRALFFYNAEAGYELQDELDYLSNRSVEPNVFFTGQFLAPAMPRLEDRQIRLAILRDTSGRNRARLLLPFSTERPGFALGAPIIRVWSNPFGPLGTPLIDGEGAAESIDNVLEAFARPDSGLPHVLVLPDIRIDGPAAQLIRAVAISRNLPVTVENTRERPMLKSLLDGDAYLRQSISAKHLHELRRQWRKLEGLGKLIYNVARQPKEIHHRMEEFLALEASGWKGREKSAMALDRLHSAFAREAIHNLAIADKVRIHTLDLDGRAIASLIVLISSGDAYAWKTAYNEDYAAFSPGKLLTGKVTDWNLDDANIIRTDSCAIPDHPIMSKFWQERDVMGTLVIGLSPNRDRDMRQVATQLHLYQNTRNVARSLRNRIMALRRK
jgi:hypothetical protein